MMFKISRKLFISTLLFALLAACTTTSYKNGVEMASVKPEVKKQEIKPQVSPVERNQNYSNLNFGLLAPLLGDWLVDDSQLQQDGTWQKQEGASWKFYPIQGGISLQDDWVSNTSSADKIPGFGTYLRVYDPMSKKWQAAWLSSRARSLELFNGEETETEVFFYSMPNEKGRITRTVFSNIQPDFFNWRMDWSNDGGETWLMVYKVNAIRNH